ncbi:AarF/ABC1/UbiB kinase family protein [Rhodococcus sp. BP-349]|uniref:ABC1 kinase family protein n=1 Tax=unclassified Rhodococcus (in: high G+C Gram-positive bacteria) TaxID=192944 RepID=UPI001C9AA48F|nr:MULTISPECIES: AarF/ABC1/UbiB kinase family protein [unclassified Rhodococcus (in: high G+C Gram-positive bacteria)]MBY6538982.1 AarF/ABC1/UbiB kinase family protein [Rhodococcus sp. BP-363]MBY6543319.1 AarF/ABC1/UbiB kinase family protein [Rhodococcus sp. BP-369]MBY6562549.1 AarF/ABC1/UbiB kinase family protein [Rhodococcus sp. BP-370]MBY6576841.1 AarF/ABC1/UbiB kinase family protein [Rhodococcus sp. BP-364]MBY6586142.1 AarF/ABC1/UbiB kinase family protein [Rhodococcus sp. BP-358]
MPDIPRSSSARTAKLASIPLGMAGRAAMGFGRKLAGGNRAEIDAELSAKAAQQMFAVLGELKGGAMKLGQALSVMEAAVPEEMAEPYREALTKLQAEAPPMPIATVHRVMDQQLGTGWRSRISDFDDTATASASIGQVHRATWSDGRDVAVKIQYPGADEALKADLKTLSRFVGILGTIVPGTDVKAVLDEMSARTEEELDYRIEGENQRAFAAVYDGDERFAVPRVVASAPKVVITEWMEGTSLSSVIATGTAEQRNTAGENLARFHFESAERVRRIHGDPHPGNFKLLGDGRLGVIDFGACLTLPDGLPPELGRMVRLSRDEEFDELTELLRETGFVIPGREVTEQEIADYLRPFTDPIKTESFHFTRKWLQGTAGKAADFNGPQFRTARSLNLPPRYAVIFRVLLGSVGICAQLDANAPYMAILTEWMPGFAE